MTTTMQKTCRTCDRELPLDAFYKDRTSRDGAGSKCRECWRAKAPRAAAPRPESRPSIRQDWELDEALPRGTMCITCGRCRDSFPENQLPRTPQEFPQCSECLAFTRRAMERTSGRRGR